MTGASDIDSKILVIEGEPETHILLKVAHGGEGSLLCEAESPVDEGSEQDVDFVILDMQLPNLGGVVESLRDFSDVPIVIVMLEHRELDAGLTAGEAADDSVQPFHSGELLAELRDAVERFAPGERSLVASISGLSMDLSKRFVTISGREVVLTPTEYELLKLLVMNAGHVVTREQLLTRIWGREHPDDTTRLRIMIRRLREKIEPDPSHPTYIKTQTGVGYRLDAPPAP